MSKHLYSKLAIIIYLLIVGGLGYYGYKIYKTQTSNPTAPTIQNSTNSAAQPTPSNFQQIANTESQDPALAGSNDSTTTTTPTGSATVSSATADNGGADAGTSVPVDPSAPPVPVTKKVSGSVLANITPEHCADNCQAFSIDLGLLEYCQEVCGISPIKNVTSCDGKDGIQKDYCLKDLAITKEEASKCSAINDANIQQTCKNRIAQDAIENQ